MGPDELIDLRAQIDAAIAASLAVTAVNLQDKIDTDAVRNLIIVKLAAENSLITQLTATILANFTLTVPPF